MAAVRLPPSTPARAVDERFQTLSNGVLGLALGFTSGGLTPQQGLLRGLSQDLGAACDAPAQSLAGSRQGSVNDLPETEETALRSAHQPP